MSSQLKKFKSSLQIGARTNKYKIMMNSKGGGPDNEITDILAKSVSLPGMTSNDIDLMIQGVRVTIAGDASYDGTINITFYDKEDHFLRRKFIKWMIFINDVINHDRIAGSTMDYMTDTTIQQLSTVDNSMVAEYKFYNVYPKSVSDITYSDEGGTLMEFTVEFNFTHWELL